MFLKLFFIFCMVFGGVVCEYELRVRVHSYLNPESRCAACTRSLANPIYSCCDNPDNTGVCSGEELCDTFFRYCLRPLGETGVQCPQNVFTDTALFQPNTDALFDIGDILFGSANPFVLSGTNWRGSQFYIESKDSDLFDIQRGGVKNIDSFAIDLNIEGGQRLEPMVYQGRFGIAEIELSFEVVCLSEYSLPDCVACEPGSSSQCIRRNVTQLATPTTTSDTPVIVARVTLPGSQQSVDDKADTGAIVGGVLGTVIVLILVLVAAMCLVVGYKVLSKKPTNYENGEKFVVTAPPLLGDNPVYDATETQPQDTVTEEEREFDNPLYEDSAPPKPQEGASYYVTLGETSETDITRYSTPYTPYYEPVTHSVA